MPADVRSLRWWRDLRRRVLLRGQLSVTPPLTLEGHTLGLRVGNGGAGLLSVLLSADGGDGSYHAAQVPPTSGGGWGTPAGWSGPAYERNGQLGLTGQVVPARPDGTGSVRFGFLRSPSDCAPRVVSGSVTGFCGNPVAGATVRLARGGTFTPDGSPLIGATTAHGGVYGTLAGGSTVVSGTADAAGHFSVPLPVPYADALAAQPHYLVFAAGGYPTRAVPIAVPDCGAFGASMSLDDVSIYANSLSLMLPSGHAVGLTRYTNGGGTSVGQFSGYFGTLSLVVLAAYKKCLDSTVHPPAMAPTCARQTVATATFAFYYRCGTLTGIWPDGVVYQWNASPPGGPTGYNAPQGGVFARLGFVTESPSAVVGTDALGVPTFAYSAVPDYTGGQPPPCGPGSPCFDLYIQVVSGLLAATTSYRSTALPQTAAGSFGETGVAGLDEAIGVGSWTVM